MFLAYEASNGKEGFAVTSEGIYAKSDGVQSFLDFDTLSHTESLRFEDNDLLADGKLLAVFSGSEEAKEKVIGLFDEIIAILRGETVN